MKENKLRVFNNHLCFIFAEFIQLLFLWHIRNLLCTVFVICCCFIVNTGYTQIRISSDFERGSIGSLKEVSKNVFCGQTMHWIKKDQIGNQYYWFYFRMNGVPNETINIHLENLEGTYRGNPALMFTDDTQPVISYDRKNWERITDVSYDKIARRFSFRFTPKESTVWLAYAYPYTLSHLEALIDSIGDNPGVETEVIGKSVEGRDINLITITNNQPNKGQKKVIVITALQHPGEDCGGYFMEGLIRELLSGKPETENIKARFIFKLVPVVNPDGLFHGVSRYNWAMEDLNTDWDVAVSDTLNMPIIPEVVAVKEWANIWLKQGNKINMFLDVHSNSQKNKGNGLINPESNLESFVKLLNNNWAIGSYGKSLKGSATSFFYNYYGIPAGTFEITQAFVKENPGVYLTIKDYLDYGKDVIYSLNDYFKEEANTNK